MVLRRVHPERLSAVARDPQFLALYDRLMDEIRAIRQSTSLPVVVGSGVDVVNVADILSLADGVIVASSLKRDGVWWNEVDPDRVSAFMSVVRSLA